MVPNPEQWKTFGLQNKGNSNQMLICNTQIYTAFATFWAILKLTAA